MKILNPKNDILYLTKEQWAKLFFALSIMLIVLYSIAMTASLCGCDYFILNFDNKQLDNIEVFLNNLHVMPLMSCVFLTIEFAIILAFTIKRLPKWYYLLSFYALRIVLSFFGNMPPIVNLIYPLTFYLTIPVIEQIKDNHKSLYNEKFSFKKYLFCLLRLVIATIISFILQMMIYAIKDGKISITNQIMSLSTHFIYALEFDIALSVIVVYRTIKSGTFLFENNIIYLLY